MIVLLLLALGVTVFLFYAFWYSPLAVRIGNELFYEPFEADIKYHERREEAER